MKFALFLAIVLTLLAMGGPARAESEPAVSSASPASRVLSGEAWEQFCDRLKAAGKMITSDGVPDTELDRAEGYRYLLASLAASIDASLYRSDLDDAHLYYNVTKFRSPAMPSADARYLGAEITGKGLYRLSGTLGNSPHITIQEYSGVESQGSFDLRKAADAQGRFSITIGGPSQDADWMELSPQASLLYFREYFSDWDAARSSELLLERLDRQERGTPLAPAILARVLEETATKLEQELPYWKGRLDQIRARQKNLLGPPGTLGGVGLGDIIYGTGWFDLEPEQALLIELSPPEAAHWSFQLGNYWGEFLDFASYTSSLNGKQAKPSSDGGYRIVIAREDPGVPNWLDTAGHREGMIFYRYHLAKTTPTPSMKLVSISDLVDLLPADTPRITPEERRSDIARRRAHVARRWAP
ncbi:MAG: hypothetical protein VCC00_07005 [Deltaproteobacteria bacterium]